MSLFLVTNEYLQTLPVVPSVFQWVKNWAHYDWLYFKVQSHSVPSLHIPHCSTTTLTCTKPLQVCANSEPALCQPKAGVRVLLISKVQMFFVAFVHCSIHWYSVTLLQLGEAMSEDAAAQMHAFCCLCKASGTDTGLICCCEVKART